MIYFKLMILFMPDKFCNKKLLQYFEFFLTVNFSQRVGLAPPDTRPNDFEFEQYTHDCFLFFYAISELDCGQPCVST